MGNRLVLSELEPVYPSCSYESVCSQFQPLDVLLFRGGDAVSATIRRMEARQVHNGAFSHAGLIVRGRNLDLRAIWGDKPEVEAWEAEPDKLYVWEITMSGKLNDGVTDIFGHSFLGVQLRPLDAVMAAIRVRTGVKVAWLPLQRPLVLPPDQLRHLLTTLYAETLEAPYEACLCVLVAATCPRLRCCSTQGTKRFFCSEFVAYILKRVGVLPATIREENVIPVDFIPAVDQDHEITCCQGPTYLV